MSSTFGFSLATEKAAETQIARATSALLHFLQDEPAYHDDLNSSL